MSRLVWQVGMATAFSVSAVLQHIAINLVAIDIFGEGVGIVEEVGFGLAVVAVALITLAPRFS